MTDDTVNVDGQDYIFDPNKVEKPEEQEEDSRQKKQLKEESVELQQSKLEQRKKRIDEEDSGNAKVIWTGGKLQ